MFNMIAWVNSIIYPFKNCNILYFIFSNDSHCSKLFIHPFYLRINYPESKFQKLFEEGYLKHIDHLHIIIMNTQTAVLLGD